VVLLSLLFVGVWAGEGEGEGYPASGTFTIYEHDNNDVFVGAAGFGQIEVFANQIYDKHDQHVVGHDQGYCANTDQAGDTWVCNIQFYLPAGQISIQGGPLDPVMVNSAVTYSIIGGTGSYDTVRGYAVVTAPSENVYEYVFHTKS